MPPAAIALRIQSVRPTADRRGGLARSRAGAPNLLAHVPDGWMNMPDLRAVCSPTNLVDSLKKWVHLVPCTDANANTIF